MSNDRPERWCALLLVLLPASALAYIDPGTSGLVLGGLGTLLAWAAVALLVLRKKLVALLVHLRRKRGRLLVAGAVALVVSGGAALWAHQQGDPQVMPLSVAGDSRFERALAIGLDGADPRVLRRLMDEGMLPVMKRLADGGGFRPLAIPNPAESPVVWAALATSQNPAANGIFDFIGRDPAKYLPRLSLLRERAGGGYEPPIRARAFWDVATENQVPSVVIRWPMTFPPSAIQGRMLAGLGVPDVRGSLGRYLVFSDQPPAADAEDRDRVIVLRLEGGQAEAEFPGPQVRSLGGVKTVTVPIRVQVDAAHKSAVVTLGGKSFALTEGGWSDFVELTFTSGLFAKHRGLTKLHLASAANPFSLLATSVELHPEAPVVQFTHPKDFGAKLRKDIGLFHTLGMPEDTKAFGNGRMSEAAFLELCRQVEAERRAMLLHELERFDGGVLAVVFDTLDRIQHMTPASEPLATSATGRYLIEFDRFLGEVLVAVGPQTPVLLFSDHGFSEFHHAVDLNRWLVSNGELAVDEAGFKARPPGSSGELYKYVRWEDTRAYAVGFVDIFLNLEGREAKGTVPPEEREATAARLAAKLEALVDPATGERIVHRVYRRDEIYHGAFLEQAPDLVVGYRPGYRGSWQSAVGGLAEAVVTPNQKPWQRDHIVDPSFVEGMVLANFEIKAERAHAYDIAPTVLTMLGLPIPAEYEGRPLQLAPAGPAEARRKGQEGRSAQ